MSGYKAYDIARYTIDMCAREHHPISNLQLQKILFFLQEGFCSANGEMLFDDDFEAWQFGPVIPHIYRLYSNWGGMRINDTYDNIRPVDDYTKSIIDPIIRQKRILYPWALVVDTHAIGSPWDVTFQNGKGDGHTIKKDLIRQDCLR